MLVAVEKRLHIEAEAFLDSVADVISHCGFQVVRWHNLDGCPPCDAAVVWNGEHWLYDELRSRRIPLLRCEMGWLPHAGTFQVDWAGINGFASWASEPLSRSDGTPIPPRKGDLLLCLQVARDTAITRQQAPASNLFLWVKQILKESRLPVRLRHHPAEPLHEVFRSVMQQAGNAAEDDSDSLAESVDRAAAVAMVSSSAGVEVIAAGVPVLCYGRAVYRHPGAAVCLYGAGGETERATQAIVDGEPMVYIEPMAEVLARILAHQWMLDDIPGRLPAMLEAIRC